MCGDTCHEQSTCHSQRVCWPWECQTPAQEKRCSPSAAAARQEARRSSAGSCRRPRRGMPQSSGAFGTGCPATSAPDLADHCCDPSLKHGVRRCAAFETHGICSPFSNARPPCTTVRTCRQNLACRLADAQLPRPATNAACSAPGGSGWFSDRFPPACVHNGRSSLEHGVPGELYNLFTLLSQHR